jgi:hypothetical protein
MGVMAVMANKASVSPASCRCVCCGYPIKAGYKYCLGCHRKRTKVYDDCIAAGKSEEWSRERVNVVYPEKFA